MKKESGVKKVKNQPKETKKVEKVSKAKSAIKRPVKTEKASPKKVSKKPAKKIVDKRVEYILHPSKIQKKRMSLSLTQGEVAEKVQLTRIHFGNIEKGLITAREAMAEKISKALNTKVSSIFKKLENGKYQAVK